MSPGRLFLATLGACAGLYAIRFCQRHDIPYQGLTIRVHEHTTGSPPRVAAAEIILTFPEPIPDEYRRAVIRAADQCYVTQSIINDMDISVSLTDGEEATAQEHREEPEEAGLPQPRQAETDEETAGAGTVLIIENNAQMLAALRAILAWILHSVQELGVSSVVGGMGHAVAAWAGLSWALSYGWLSFSMQYFEGWAGNEHHAIPQGVWLVLAPPFIGMLGGLVAVWVGIRVRSALLVIEGLAALVSGAVLMSHLAVAVNLANIG